MAEKLLAYHGDPKLKRKLMARVRAHRKADELVRGETWRSNGVTRGCAVGCTIHCYEHAKYPEILGVPEVLARLEDWLFENLPGDHLAWPERFLRSIRPGADLSNVYPQWVCRLLQRRLDALGNEPCRVKCREAIGNVRDLWSRGWPTASAARSVASAASAESSAWSAESSALAAWSSALAAWSAESAESAAWSAECAASAARSAEPAARSAEVQQQADDLLELLKQAA